MLCVCLKLHPVPKPDLDSNAGGDKSVQSEEEEPVIDLTTLINSSILSSPFFFKDMLQTPKQERIKVSFTN